MADTAVCPVCGAAQAQGFGCAQCGFPYAFARSFSDEASFRAWQDRVEQASAARRADGLRGMPLLAVSMTGVAALHPRTHTLQMYSRFGVDRRFEQVSQVSLSDSHRVILLEDGRVQAYGDDTYSPCNVKQLKDIVWIFAINNCTLAVDSSGRIHQRGYFPLRDEIEHWDRAARIWGSQRMALCVRQDGSVLMAGKRPFTGSNSLSRSVEELGGKAVYAVGCQFDRSLCAACILLGDGQARFIPLVDNGQLASAQFPQEKDYIDIAATLDAILLLRRNGMVDIWNGTPEFRQEVSSWRDILFLAANETCAAAVDTRGELHLAGQCYCSTSLVGRGKWNKDFLLG